MTQNPLVSIIVPVYNASMYLPRCIESIINQDYCNKELILVDDGSSDGSSEICDSYANNDKCPVYIIHKSNGGVTEARIDGYNKSQGDYVMFVDADDYLSLDALSIMSNVAEKYNADFVVTQNNIVHNACSMTKSNRSAKTGYYNRTDIIDLLNSTFLFDKGQDKSGFPLFLWGKLYKRDLLEGVLDKSKGFWYGEDIICVIEFIERALSIYVLDKPLYNYVCHDSQVTKKSTIDLWPQYVRVWEHIRGNDTNNYFKKQLPERIWSFCCSKLWLCSQSFSRKEFSETYNVVREPNIVKQLVLDKNSIIQGPANNMFKFFMRNGWGTLHYWFLHYGIIERIKRILK